MVKSSFNISAQPTLKHNYVDFNGHKILFSTTDSAGLCLKCALMAHESDKGGAEQLFVLSRFTSECVKGDAQIMEWLAI